MCTNHTKQEYIFLESFDDPTKKKTRREVLDGMHRIAADVFADGYLVNAPRSIKELYARSAIQKYIEQRSADEWAITEEGLKWKNFQFQKYIQPLKEYA